MAFTKAQREELAQLHEKGLGRNAIAAAMGVGQRQVSEEAEALGLKFNRAITEAATRARENASEEKRSLLLQEQLNDALRLREQLWAPCTIGQFGGRDNTWSEVALDRPLFADQLRIQQAVSGAIANVTKLLESQQGSNRATINLVIATAEKLGLTETDGE